jgi:hypothetical protein
MALDHFAGEYLVGMAHEVLQQGKFFRVQFEMLIPAPDIMCCRVDRQVAKSERPTFFGGGAAHERTQAGQQLVQRKRLDHVIIGPAIKSLHPVFDSIARRQHQNRRVYFMQPQGAAYGYAIFSRQQDIQDDRIIGYRLSK